jgi:mannose-6-phosphate isomerase-like protein (cupin superfamily)
MPATRVLKMWGREVILHNGAYCAKLLQYDGVRTSSKHYHENKHETFVIVSGDFEIEWYPVGVSRAKWAKQILGPGAALVLEPRTVHKVTCLSPEGGMIAEASSHDDPEDCVRLEASVNPFGK